MPAASHDISPPPDDPDIKIWRYMDFTKFVSMLENQGLFFCRADKLGDRFEGSIPKELAETRDKEQSRNSRPKWVSATWKLLNRMHAKWAMISCWHMNSHESAAMWKIYTMTKESIAIRSTFAKLRDGLDETFKIGTVKYIDYETDRFPRGNLLYPLFHKRLSFAHEREVRALNLEVPWMEIMSSKFKEAAESDLLESPVQPPDGIWKEMNLHELIDAVYVSPDSPPWFKPLVEQVLRRYSFDIGVTQSSLDNDPLF